MQRDIESVETPSTPDPQPAWDERKPRVPMQVGWLQPGDIAPVAVFLASDAAKMVTGPTARRTSEGSLNGSLPLKGGLGRGLA